jgi:small conductance mechanosensitive channel
MTNFVNWAPNIIVALAIFIAFLILAKVLRHFFDKLTSINRFDPQITSLISRVVSILIVVLGAITALGTIGINISAVVAGLGLTGFAIGFAFKDSISNLLAGILLLIYRPFKLKDYITIAGHEGLVTNIDLRYTTIENDQHRILIPNSKILTDPIKVKLV